MTVDLYHELLALVGLEGPPEVGPDRVCKEMIRHYCEVTEDDNPLHTDEAYARNSKYGDIVSPPMMIYSWGMPPLWPNGQSTRWRDPLALAKDCPDDPQMVISEKCNRAGLVGVLATNSTLEFFQPLVVGDRVSVRKKFVSVSPEKITRPGVGHFVTFLRTYTNQRDEVVCEQHFTLFKFRPPVAE